MSGVRWARFSNLDGSTGFGIVDGDAIKVHHGDMYSESEPSGEHLALESVTLLTPCQPSKVIGLWNNLATATAKFAWSTPREPLYFIKPSSSLLAPGAAVARPSSYAGRIVYEGELGVVIGERCVDVAAESVDDVIFGYTCINDVTALDLITEDDSFAQWTRAKSFDTFAAVGPFIATGLDPDLLHITTLVGGKARQDYDVSDMIFSPRQLVSLVSRGMTLERGDVIACGTSVGAMPMRPGVRIDVQIEGIGVLSNELGA